jgi:hypothetical protein
MLYLTVVRQLLPGIVVIICFIQSILWGAGFIGTTLELWVLNGGVNKHCRLSVNANSLTGKSVQTYAWLEQRSICDLLFSHGSKRERADNCVQVNVG